MSSYLNFYGRLRENPESEPVLFLSYSRSSDMYQEMYENLSVPYDEDGTKFLKLTSSNLDEVLKQIQDNISSTRSRIKHLEDHANGNKDIIYDIVSLEEYTRDLERTRHSIEIIKDIVEEATFDYSGFSEILVNIR